MPCFLSGFEAPPFVGSANNVYHSKFVGIIVTIPLVCGIVRVWISRISSSMGIVVIGLRWTSHWKDHPLRLNETSCISHIYQRMRMRMSANAESQIPLPRRMTACTYERGSPFQPPIFQLFFALISIVQERIFS